MNMEETIVLFDYDAWATGRTLEAVSALPEVDYLADRKSSHGGIHGTLVHVYGAGVVWFSRWTGSSARGFIRVSEIPSLGALKERWTTYAAELHAYLGALTEEKLAAPLSYADLKGNHQAEPLFQQMQHAVNHASYHRGQVVTMLRQAGATPANTDLIAYYRTRRTPPLRDTLERKNY